MCSPSNTQYFLSMVRESSFNFFHKTNLLVSALSNNLNFWKSRDYVSAILLIRIIRKNWQEPLGKSRHYWSQRPSELPGKISVMNFSENIVISWGFCWTLLYFRLGDPLFIIYVKLNASTLIISKLPINVHLKWISNNNKPSQPRKWNTNFKEK